MFGRANGHSHVNSKADRKRAMMPPPPPVSPPFKKPKVVEDVNSSIIREGGGRVSQGCQTSPPPACKHGDEDEKICPIGTPVSLPATVWYEDRDGE